MKKKDGLFLFVLTKTLIGPYQALYLGPIALLVILFEPEPATCILASLGLTAYAYWNRSYVRIRQDTADKTLRDCYDLLDGDIMETPMRDVDNRFELYGAFMMFLTSFLTDLPMCRYWMLGALLIVVAGVIKDDLILFGHCRVFYAHQSRKVARINQGLQENLSKLRMLYEQLSDDEKRRWDEEHPNWRDYQ